MLACQHSGQGSGWQKFARNPVLGGNLGTCFDVAVLRAQGQFQMWFSWRPEKSIALVKSHDGIQWSEPLVALGPDSTSGWESIVNRPCVVKHGSGYHMWYTGQTDTQSRIGYAVSRDGVTWTRASNQPVLSPEAPWEKAAVMCPHVMWDEENALFRMWYSGGEQYEPDAIGYATSPDGLVWTRPPGNVRTNRVGHASRRTVMARNLI